MSNDALPCQRVVVGPLKEVLIGVWVENKFCSATSELGAEIRPIKSRQPKLLGFYGGVGSADHLEFEVCDKLFFGKWQIIDEVISADAAVLFATETYEIDGSFRFCTRGQYARQF